MIPQKYDKEQLKKGLEVEKEHTDDPKVALKIAMDHLDEDPKYYDKLIQAGLEEYKNKMSEDIKNPYVDKLIAECNRITKILKDDELFEKERKKHQK